jgi:hypothetical protein
MFLMNGWEFPKLKDEKGENINFHTDKGCSLNPIRRSKICTLHICNIIHHPIVEILKENWDNVERQINEKLIIEDTKVLHHIKNHLNILKQFNELKGGLSKDGNGKNRKETKHF